MEETEARAMVEERRKGASYADLARKYGIAKEEARVICESAADPEVKCPCGTAYLRVAGGYVPVCACAVLAGAGIMAAVAEETDG